MMGSALTVLREGEQLDAGTETNINLNHEVYYHYLGTDQSEDILCWKDVEHPKWSFATEVTEDGKVRCSLAVSSLVNMKKVSVIVIADSLSQIALLETAAALSFTQRTLRGICCFQFQTSKMIYLSSL